MSNSRRIRTHSHERLSITTLDSIYLFVYLLIYFDNLILFNIIFSLNCKTTIINDFTKSRGCFCLHLFIDVFVFKHYDKCKINGISSRLGCWSYSIDLSSSLIPSFGTDLSSVILYSWKWNNNLEWCLY